MTTKTFFFRCWNCGTDNRTTAEVPDNQTTTDKKTPIHCYCENCKLINILNVPDTWDASPLVLGDDNDILDYKDGLPIIQGHKP